MTARRRRPELVGVAALPPADSPTPGRPQHPAVPVLLTVSADGFIQAFAEPRTVKLHIVNLLDVAPVNEALAERLAEMQMPSWARQLYVPRNCIATASVAECWTVEQEMWRRWRLELVRELRATSEALKGKADGK